MIHWMIHMMVGLMLLAFAYSIWSTWHDCHVLSIPSRMRRLSVQVRIALFVTGTILTIVGDAAGNYIVRPLIQTIVGPPVMTDYITPSFCSDNGLHQ